MYNDSVAEVLHYQPDKITLQVSVLMIEYLVCGKRSHLKSRLFILSWEIF